MDQFSNLGPVKAIAQFWNSLTSPQKLVTSIFVAASIALLAVVSVVASQPKMEVLFSGLQSEDAGAIVAKLQERKIEYQLDGGGAVIKVPSKDVHELRLQMATDGLPQGGNVGFEIFDKTSLGMTEFAQRLNFQRALQGELTRTINQIDRVQQSRVHIAIPERNLFDKGDKHPQASVVLKLRPGGSLGGDQVAGIVHLVSSAVEGLKPNYITVVDTRGNVLSEANDEGNLLNARLSATQLEVKQTHERQMQQNIESMLERVLGPNKAIVRVNMSVNFDQKEISSETYEPVKSGAVQSGSVTETGEPVEGYRGVLLSEQRMEETYGGNSAGDGGSVVISGVPGRVGGPVGTEMNTRPGMASSVSESEGGYRKQETMNKYEVSKTTQHVVEMPGSIERVSVAVMLDGKVDTSKVPAIRRVVEASAGIDAERGDNVIVESVPFDDSFAKEEEKDLKAVASKESYLSIGKTVGGVLLLLGFLFFLRGLLKQINLGSPQGSAGGSWQPTPVPAQATYGPMVAEAPAGAVAGVSPSTLSQQSPQEVAQVVREWLTN